MLYRAIPALKEYILIALRKYILSPTNLPGVYTLMAHDCGKLIFSYDFL